LFHTFINFDDNDAHSRADDHHDDDKINVLFLFGWGVGSRNIDNGLNCVKFALFVNWNDNSASCLLILLSFECGYCFFVFFCLFKLVLLQFIGIWLKLCLFLEQG
jgi:hypothetical protein